MRFRLRGGRSAFALGLLVAVLVALPFVVPYYTTLLLVVGIHSMLTVGLCLLMGYTGQVSLGHAAFYGIGAFFSAVLSTTYGVNPWLAMLMAAAATGTVAFLAAFLLFRLRGNYLAMGTLGFGIVVWWALNNLEQFTGGIIGLWGVPHLSIGGFAFDTDLKCYYLVWAVSLAILLISQNIVGSRVGRALRAIESNEAAARSVGVDVGQFKTKVFVLSAVYASIAGSLFAHYLAYVSPQPFGFLFSIRLVVMAVVGGLASIWGALLGTAVVTFMGEVLHRFGDLDIIIFGFLLMVVIIFLPQGVTRGLVTLLQKLGATVRGMRV